MSIPISKSLTKISITFDFFFKMNLFLNSFKIRISNYFLKIFHLNFDRDKMKKVCLLVSMYKVCNFWTIAVNSVHKIFINQDCVKMFFIFRLIYNKSCTFYQNVYQLKIFSLQRENFFRKEVKSCLLPNWIKNWICPACEFKNFSSNTSVWNCGSSVIQLTYYWSWATMWSTL